MKRLLGTTPPNPFSSDSISYRIFEAVSEHSGRTAKEWAEHFYPEMADPVQQMKRFTNVLYSMGAKDGWIIGAAEKGGNLTFLERQRTRKSPKSINDKPKKPHAEVNPLSELLEKRIVALTKIVEWKSGSIKSSADLLSKLDNLIIEVINV